MLAESLKLKHVEKQNSSYMTVNKRKWRGYAKLDQEIEVDEH